MQSNCNTYIFCKNVCLKDKIVFHNGMCSREGQENITKRVFKPAFHCGIITRIVDMRKDIVCK